MRLIEKAITIPISTGGNLVNHVQASLRFRLKPNETPIRFVITSSDDQHYFCEVGVIDHEERTASNAESIFAFRRRVTECTEKFNAVLVVPTGVGAEIGGHAGDATAASKLIGEVCDRLIIHPNVVNASDINEMPINSLYVEGSVLSRLLMGTAGLQPVRSNRVLVVLDSHPDRHFIDAAVNTVSAARSTYGLSCPEVVLLDPPIWMHAEYAESGRAIGQVTSLGHCLSVLERNRSKYDAVAFSSVIRVPTEYHVEYFQGRGKMVNPWGGVEAMLTHAMSSLLDVPTAHSPMFESRKVENLEAGIVEPRMSAEAISLSFLQCILKGLQKSPRIVTDVMAMVRPEIFSVEDVSCLVIPDGCLGIPTIAALYQGIPVIAVRGNDNLMRNDLSLLPWPAGQYFPVENYLEAVGVVAALRAGVALEAVRRPIGGTRVRSASIENTSEELASKRY